jgi:hypothetical protein
VSDKGTSETNVLVPNVGREIGIRPWRAIGTVLGRQLRREDRQDLDPVHGLRILRDSCADCGRLLKVSHLPETEIKEIKNIFCYTV